MKNIKRFRKLFFYFSILFAFLFSVSSYAQSFNWVNQAGGFGYDISSHMCRDLAGNIYVSARAGGGGNNVIIANDTFIVNGQDDIFLTKYNQSGNKIWTKQFGGNNFSTMPYSTEGVNDMLFDSVSNCIYVTGTYYQSCQFDTISLSTQIGDNNLFLAKIDVNGSFLWVKNFGAINGGNEFPMQMTVDKNKNLFLIGGFSSGGFIDTTSVIDGGFLAKINSNGDILFIKKTCTWNSFYNGPAFYPQSISYSEDHIFINGGNNDTLTIDSIQILNIDSLTQIITCWDTSGSILWERHSLEGDVYGSTFLINDAGHLFITNYFKGPWIRYDVDTIFANANTGGILLKYNSLGTLLWVKSIEVGQTYYPMIGKEDEENNFYLTGYFKDSLSFGNVNLVSNFPGNFYNSFVARFDSSGNCIGAVQADNVQAKDLEVDNNSNVYLVGGFSNTAHFGNITLVTNNSSDMFLANLSAITGSGGNERAINNQLIIYANPNKGSFKIKLPDAITDLTGAILTVYDVQGKEVARFNLEQTSVHPQLEINNAIAGLYTVRLVKGKQVFNGKLVVE